MSVDTATFRLAATVTDTEALLDDGAPLSRMVTAIDCVPEAVDGIATEKSADALAPGARLLSDTGVNVPVQPEGTTGVSVNDAGEQPDESLFFTVNV